MSKPAGRLLSLAIATTVPALAAAQSTAAFDGTYAGVSRTLATDNLRRTCPPSGALAALTISNGSARAKWATGTFEGQVSPQGVLTMNATNGAHFDGQIDGQGNIRGRTGNFIPGRGGAQTGCAYDLTWKKTR